MAEKAPEQILSNPNCFYCGRATDADGEEKGDRPRLVRDGTNTKVAHGRCVTALSANGMNPRKTK